MSSKLHHSPCYFCNREIEPGEGRTVGLDQRHWPAEPPANISAHRDCLVPGQGFVLLRPGPQYSETVHA